MQASEVLLQTAALLNDASQVYWTNTVLLPCVAKASEELAQLLELNEMPVLNQSQSPVVNVAIGDTSLSQYPVDLIEPIALFERAQGSSNDWVEVGEVDWIDPNLLTDSVITQWCWRNSLIYINPPQTARETFLRYTRGLAAITSTGSTIEIPMSKTYLAVRAAQIAALNLGNNPSKALSMNSDVLDAQYKLIQTLGKNNQGVAGKRRRPYKGRNRRYL